MQQHTFVWGVLLENELKSFFFFFLFFAQQSSLPGINWLGAWAGYLSRSRTFLVTLTCCLFLPLRYLDALVVCCMLKISRHQSAALQDFSLFCHLMSGSFLPLPAFICLWGLNHPYFCSPCHVRPPPPVRLSRPHHTVTALAGLTSHCSANGF